MGVIIPGLKPGYDQKSFAPDSWKNRLLAVASGQGIPGAVGFHADATLYRSDLDKGQAMDFRTDPRRKVFIYLTEGNLGINDLRLAANDQARVEMEGDLVITAHRNSRFVLIFHP